MCDRMISPLKMMQRIKHMVQNFEEKDRIQLHELLDLLLWYVFICGCNVVCVFAYMCVYVSAWKFNYLRSDLKLSLSEM